MLLDSPGFYGGPVTGKGGVSKNMNATAGRHLPEGAPITSHQHHYNNLTPHNN